MPKAGSSDLFEREYLAEFWRRLTPHGIPIEYKADRAALDGGLHLYRKGDGLDAEVSDVRVWFQCKGIQRSTLGVAEFHARDCVAVSGLALEHVQFWYSAPEPVYLVVYVEAVDEFLAADMCDLVDHRGGAPFLRTLRRDGQKTLTLGVPRGATLDIALARMPAHRSLRIDGPAFRGRPLGHRYDPLRSQLDTMPPAMFEDLVRELLSAHDFRAERQIDIASLLDRDIGRVTGQVGTLYLTYEWTFPGATEYGFSEGTDFRIEAKPVSAHGRVAIVCHSHTPSDTWAYARDRPVGH